MNAQKILFPTDFSSASNAALKYATALARDARATLLILHVQEAVSLAAGEMYLPPTSVPNPALEQSLSTVVPEDPLIVHEHILAVGGAAEEILRIAKEQAVDLIVMGTHGRTGFVRFVMGSVAETVVRRAECPVLTVKETHEASIAAPTTPRVPGTEIRNG